MGLRPVGDSAILAVRPALLLPWEDVRVGCSKEPFLQAKRKPTTTSGMNPRTSKITKDRQGKHTPQAAHYLELLLLEYNLRKCILFKDSMLRTGGRLQRLSSCQMQEEGKKGKLLLWETQAPKSKSSRTSWKALRGNRTKGRWILAKAASGSTRRIDAPAQLRCKAKKK